ncbi:MAG: Sulfite exporter TauE/SafE, partial [Firmicutes bacterium]|nr:Sulfite exporter TauE/SafE [Bacillota bacterium]
MEKIKALLIGFTGGIVGGLLGIGGAIILVPLMVHYLGVSQHMAHATSLAVIIPGAAI